MIEKVVKEGLKSKADEVIVVLGYEAEEVRAAIKEYRCKPILNERFGEGQSSSVKCGVRAVAGHADAVLILPGDCALVSAHAINKVIDSFRASKSSIIVASHKKRRGHPILIDRSLFSDVLEIDEGRRGLKGFLQKHSSTVIEVDVGSEDVLVDLDTKEDFEKYFPRRTS